MTAEHGPVYRLSKDVAVVGEGDRIVVLDLTRLDRPPMALEGTAARIWQAIDGERDQEQVIAHLAGAYGTTSEQIAGDVRIFLGQLVDLSLVDLTLLELG